MSLLKKPAKRISTTPHKPENTRVNINAVLKYNLSFDCWFLYSEVYLTIPEPIPPVAKVIIIAEKLFNCPNKAIPAGPIMTATTFTEIKLVIILTSVDTVVSPKTFASFDCAIFFI